MILKASSNLGVHIPVLLTRYAITPIRIDHNKKYRNNIVVLKVRAGASIPISWVSTIRAAGKLIRMKKRVKSKKRCEYAILLYSSDEICLLSFIFLPPMDLFLAIFSFLIWGVELQGSYRCFYSSDCRRLFYCDYLFPSFESSTFSLWISSWSLNAEEKLNQSILYFLLSFLIHRKLQKNTAGQNMNKKIEKIFPNNPQSSRLIMKPADPKVL